MYVHIRIRIFTCLTSPDLTHGYLIVESDTPTQIHALQLAKMFDNLGIQFFVYLRFQVIIAKCYTVIAWKKFLKGQVINSLLLTLVNAGRALQRTNDYKYPVISIYISFSLSLSLSLYIYIYMCVCVYVCVCVCVCVRVYFLFISNMQFNQGKEYTLFQLKSPVLYVSQSFTSRRKQDRIMT